MIAEIEVNVIEIGPGIGALMYLASAAEVMALRLMIVCATFGGYPARFDNVTVVNRHLRLILPSTYGV